VFPASLIALVRWITGRHLKPLEVRLAGEPPLDATPYQALFEAPLSFGHGQCALLFAHADMSAALPTANAELARLHDRFAGDYLARFASSRFSHQTRQVLCRLLPQGEPRREAVAEALHLSERTLQRRLQEEGSSYQQLLDDTRRELAEQYLATPHDPAGNRLPARLLRAEQFLPCLPPLVRSDAGRVPRALVAAGAERCPSAAEVAGRRTSC
jgi:AraC-like DNA-binding protein